MINVFTFTPSTYFGSNMYLIESDGEYAVIDPSVEYNEVIRRYPMAACNIKYIFITHAHFDHFLKLDSWDLKSTTVCIGEFDAYALSNPLFNCSRTFLNLDIKYNGEVRKLKNEEKIRLGNENITVILTPGHSAGAVAYQIGNNLFVGDTIFEGGGYGRYDLPGSDAKSLFLSIQKLKHGYTNSTVYAGHGGVFVL